MDFFNFQGLVNAGLCGAVVIIVQVIKKLIDKENKLNEDIWVVVVLLSGIPCAVIMNMIDGWVGADIIQIIFNFIVKSFLYSAVSSLMFQTGKMSLGAFFGDKK